MKILWTFLILLALFSCNEEIKNTKILMKPKSAEQSENLITEIEISERLKNHFELYRITPSIIINNTEGKMDILLGKHRIKFFNTDKETKIKVDNDLFTLKDKVTLNVVHYSIDSVDFVNAWDNITLFKYNGRELIGIRTSFDPCTGIGCNINYYLIYDVTTKTKNFFGTFGIDNQLNLFDFNNDDKLDYVSKTFNGDAHGSTLVEFIYELYSMDLTGQFIQQRDSMGMVYQIKHTTFSNDSIKSDKFEEHWIKKIK